MKKISIILFIFLPGLVFAQSSNLSGLWSSHYERANHLFDFKFYEEAISHYQKEIERNGYHPESYLKIAYCFRILGDYESSKVYYSVVFDQSEIEDPIHKYYFAEALMSMGEFEEAIKWYLEYSKDAPDDPRPQNKINGITEIQTFYQDSSLVNIKPFSQNTNLTEFGAVNYKDEILFSSSRSKNLLIRHDYNKKLESLLHIYSFKKTDEGTESVEHIKLPKYSVSNDGPLVIGDDFIVVTRNVGKDKDELINHLGLFFFDSDIYSQKLLYEFNYNSDDYSIQHPALSEKGDTLIFSSDMPGGFGNNDLYYSIYDDGKWTSPVNMGSNVNTPGEETFPFYSNGILYFSSNGHAGLGGLDIYKVGYNKDEEVDNMGYPINSRWDDFSIYLEGSVGYFASNRPGGLGHDDIYEFVISPPPPTPTPTPVEILILKLELIISDQLNKERIPFADILINIDETQESLVYKASKEGEMNDTIKPGNYRIKISSKNYETKYISLDIVDKSIVKEIFLIPEIKLDNILFEFDKFTLTALAIIELDRIADLMKKYPTIVLNLEGHTDSRGNTSYNLWLSTMRATSTRDYLLEQGIETERIQFEGFGESMLVNNCEDFVRCTEEEHSENRRIVPEFSNIH